MHLLMYIGNRHESVVCFTDGATSDCEVGRGSAAAILLKLNPDGKELEVTEVLNKTVDSIEAELSAIALALEASFEYLIRIQWNSFSFSPTVNEQ